jgi:hypothetical protein
VFLLRERINMPIVGAEYQRPQGSGAQVQSFLNAYDQTSSIMDRKQRLNMAQQQQDNQNAEFQAKLPAIQADAGLQIAKAAAAIKLSADNSIQETKAAQAWAEPDGYNEEYQNIIQTVHDPKERSDALESLQGKVAWTKQFKAFAPGVDAINNARASAFTMALTNVQIAGHYDQAEAQIKARQQVVDTQVGGANQRADVRAGAVKYVSDNKLSAEQNKQNKIGSQIADMQDRVAEAEQNAADAQREGDARSAEVFRSNAASMRDGIQKLTTFAGSTPSAPRTAAEDPKARPKAAPQEFPPLTFGGQSLASPDHAAAVADKIGADWTDVTLPSGKTYRMRRKQ